MAEATEHLPFDIDARSPSFARDMLEWAQHAATDMQQTVATTQRTIAASHVVIADTDRILGRR